MIRWVLVIFLALMLISWFTPLLQRLGLGRLPGDFRFRLFGRDHAQHDGGGQRDEPLAAGISRLI